MSRISATFNALKASGRKALIPYITAGDPQPDLTVSLMHALVEGGADIIELGVPFSDPMADGPVIQLACERALAHDTSLRDVLVMVREFRQDNTETPVVLMGYLNPVEVMGYQAFADAAADAGVDGVLLVDLPPEEAGPVSPVMQEKDLDMIYLLAPTTTEERIRRITSAGNGYVYYVSLKGVTGANTLNVEEVRQRVETIRKITDLPIGVGFGIKDAESAQAVSRVSDGVVVGSVLVNAIAEFASHPGQKKEILASTLKGLLQQMREAMDA